MKNLIILITFLLSFPAPALALDCKVHKTACQILKNAPEMKVKKALELSNVIIAIAKRYQLPTRLITAIARQESNYNVSAKNCTTGYRDPSEVEQDTNFSICMRDSGADDFENRANFKSIQKSCELKSRALIVDKICSDFGFLQTHIKTIHNFDFDVIRMQHDLAYSIESGVIVLKDFQRMYGKKEPENWWTRYNSSNDEAREIYRKKVERWM